MDDKTCMIRVTRLKGEVTQISVDAGDGDELFWRPGAPMLAYRFILKGRWRLQALHWSCRGGAARLFQPLSALYGYLVRNGYVRRGTLRQLAGGARVFELRADGQVLARGHEASAGMQAFYSLCASKPDTRRAVAQRAFGSRLPQACREISARILRTSMSATPHGNVWHSVALA